ncbi:MAG: hypothetical protein KIG85_02945 [Thiopseudomonas sp.]|nr:hypothetical protein [Thiopseudomonas sp.]
MDTPWQGLRLSFGRATRHFGGAGVGVQGKRQTYGSGLAARRGTRLGIKTKAQNGHHPAVAG